ncbi:MAG: aminomethyl-transferring glycine dehydrogenase subunit GcvPA [Prevotella sp.]
MKYFPHTAGDVSEMLERCGADTLDGLYADIPEGIRFKGDYDIPSSMSEQEIRLFFDQLANQNKQLTCFAGAGVYDHYVPALIPQIAGRSEFLTSYTPYQAEISQGTLHYIFEYQSMMAELTGMDISNASLYDGATATAEATMMACAATKKCDTVLMSETVDPKVAEVVDTYAHFHGMRIVRIPETNGSTDFEQMGNLLDGGGVAGVIVQQPNRYGIVEDLQGVADNCHAHKALLIMNSIAADLAVLKTPGEWGADIAVGEGQSLGIPMSWGGPYIGYMCTTEKLMRKMPGRIVGKTQDSNGQRAFVLTLQAREQHIRRQKATSNICSNQSLMALWVTIYMATMGKKGLKEAAQISCDAAHYLAEALCSDTRFTLTFDKPFFNEFCVTYDGNLDALLAKLTSHGIFGGVKVADNVLMIAVTEKRTKEEIDQLISLCHEQ